MTKTATPSNPNTPMKKQKSPLKILKALSNRSNILKSANGHFKSSKGTSALATIDIATGKHLVNIYFDPKNIVDSSADALNDTWLDYHLYEPANVLKDENGILTIRMTDGKLFKSSSATSCFVHEQDNEGVDDILKLREFSEMSLIHTLRVRYGRDEIYTFVGTILISINPYKWLKDLYSDIVMQEYHKSSHLLQPHLFTIADHAYHALMSSRLAPYANDQSIIISGESGAGKTEATKVIMTYLARVTILDHSSHGLANSKSGNLPSGALEEKVLSTNPLLEAFGNARTLRNDNSSRFGKFIKIEFSNTGRIVGATIEKYLLEKTRIIHQIEGERSYHIFYQLLRGASPSMLTSLNLVNSADTYSVLMSRNSYITNMDDAHEFQVTQGCMRSVGIDDATQSQLFSLIAGILHLCNVGFEKDDSEGQVGSITEASVKFAEYAAQSFGVETEDLLTAISKQNMYVGGSTIVKLQSRAQAIDKRNSFAKSIYMMIFNWLVDQINQNIAAPAGLAWGFIGVLDIYGFENFDSKNSFEQLLINYANEKLQNHFNKHIFQLEQIEYENEGIDWTFVVFNDNSPCVELIDGRPNGKSGIFQTLDDCVSSGRSDVNINSSFLAQLNGTVRHTNYRTSKFNSDQRFGVLHYAGEVFYEIDGFVEKNRDSMNTDMKDLMAKSSNTLLSAIVDDSFKSDATVTTTNSTSSKQPLKRSGSVTNTASSKISPRGSVNKLKEDSISKQFSMSLKQLYDTLDKTEPHFIRCIKPNSMKAPDSLNIRDISLQLKYAGMMEAIRIRQQGYALREMHDQFFNRYSALRPACKTLQELVSDLSVMLKVRKEAWQVGTTKVFIRQDLNERLEILLSIRYSYCVKRIQRIYRYHRANKSAKKIQTCYRRHYHLLKFKRLLTNALRLQTALRRWRCVRSYRASKNAVIKMQSIVRGRIAKKLAKKLAENSYFRMSSEHLLDLMRSTQSDLKVSFANKNFALCDELEGKLREMKAEYFSRLVVHVKPISRHHLELLVRERELALKSGSYSTYRDSLSSLQSSLDNLISSRKLFPTVEEVRLDIANVRLELDNAMSKKDFRKCAELQKRISELEIEEKKFSSDVSFDPTLRVPLPKLKQMKDELDLKIANALESRNFDVCSNLHLELEKITSSLQSRDVSPSEAEVLVEQKRRELIDAMDIGDFHHVVELEDDIEELLSIVATTQVVHETEIVTSTENQTPQESYEDLSIPELNAMIIKIESELKDAEFRKELKLCGEINEKLVTLRNLKAERSPKITRTEVLAMVKAKEQEIEKALTAKKYKECEVLNGEMSKLKELLETMPTSTELLSQIRILEKELNDLIAAKTYAKCEEIEFKLAGLKAHYEEVLAEEKLSEPVAEAPIVKMSTRALHPTDKAILSSPRIGKSSKYSNDGKENSFPPAQTGSSSLESEKPKTLTSTLDRPVSKLRPKPPVIAGDSLTLREVAVKMANSRADAALLLSEKGSLAGIITDNDFTRRVISQSLDIDVTIVRDVMTKKPKCVRLEDSALEALEMMVDNHFRHLPVLDKDGAVVGLLDIAKCLYDAISVLEKVHGDEGTEDSESSAAKVGEAMATAMKKVAGSRGANKAQLLAMTALMEQMFGGAVPTLRDIVSQHEFKSVSPSTTIREASLLMAEARKGVLIVDRKLGLQGILTPKDVLTRVVAKGLSPDEVTVASVMTPNPDTVSPDLTVIDALKDMHDHKYLHLPVQEENGRVIGLVSVMELVDSAAGKEGGKGWRTFFKGAMDARGDQDVSDVNSIRSVGMSTRKSLLFSAKKEESFVDSKANVRSVAKLRPKFPIICNDVETLQEVAVKMANSRADAALLLSEKGSLAGIITDNDFTRRVISQSLDIDVTIVRDVMTKKPKCVRLEDSALEALEMMVDNHFRHLPVLDKDGAVVGLLDIAKCLYDAISVLEKVHGDEGTEDSESSAAKVGEAMATAMKKVAGSRGANKAQLLAMTALMEQMFGGAVPTLRDIVSQHEFKSVSPSTTIREASLLMAEARKGVLIVDRKLGLQGILTPKDVLTRVVAKGLSPDEVTVASVMTPNPDTVSPDLTVIDALKDMHDHKYLHLPVQEENGRVIGLVSVMELVDSAAGKEGGKGWRTFFKGAMDARGDQDVSDTNSNRSAGMSTRKSLLFSAKKEEGFVDNKANVRSVAKLRPKFPIICNDVETLQEVALKMANSRADAALLLSEKGSLAGIITDNDFTRRVISQSLDIDVTIVRDVMTKKPKCVRLEDSALEALEMMVDNHFRHLPVLDKDGAVVGLLDIAKCLYDAISVLEKVHGDEGTEDSESSAAKVGEAMATAMKKVAGSRGSNKAQLLAMTALMEQMFGGAVPTLRDIVSQHEFKSVSPSTTIREASLLMAEARKGVLIVDRKLGLQGILTPKDVLTRVVAKGLSPDEVTVASVMTPNPDTVSPELTVIDALKDMHDHKYLHLPVQEENGRVIGLVSVMELVDSAAGKEGGKGWRTFFKGAMDARGDQDVSDTNSNRSAGMSIGKSIASARVGSSALISEKSPIAPLPKKRQTRPVSKLRPKAPLVVRDSTLLQELAETMAKNRVDAALMVSDEGTLSGIITDNDFTRRVVSVYLNTTEIQVNSVMTQNPKCVRSDDSALEALEMMVDNRFRHLPVLDKDGAVVGLLDIAKCLYDAISVLEKVHGDEGTEDSESSAAKVGEAMATAMKKVAGSRGANKAQLLAMTALMEQMFGGAIPTLREIIADHRMVVVRPTANVREAATIMAQARKGVLVMDEDELVGILTPKDILSRVVATRKSPDLTSVSSVMTPNPDCVDANITVIDALRDMHDHKYLHLPVRDEYGRVIGLVDVMELVTHSAGGGSQGGKGWKALLSDAMEAPADDVASDRDNGSLFSLPMSYMKPSGTSKPRIRASYLDQPPPQQILQVDDSSDVFSVSAGMKHLASIQSGYNNSNYDSASVLFSSDFVYKIVCKDGHIHRVKSSPESLDILKVAVAEKLQVSIAADSEVDIVLKYVDDDKDEVIISSDAALRDAVEFARSSGLTTLKVSAYIVDKTAKAKIGFLDASWFNNYDKKKVMISVGGIAAAAAAVGAFVLMRRR